MFKRFLSALLLTAMTLPVLSHAADRVGDFSLLDQDGYFHQMSWYDNNAAIALLVQAVGSEASDTALADYASLRDEYSAQGIQFFMINPMGLSDRSAVTDVLAEAGIDMPVLMDDARYVSKSLGIDKTGEVLVYDPSSFSVVFRGPVGTALEQALQAIVSDESIANPVVAANGDPVTYPDLVAHAETTPSYERDIAPIIADNCASCHREGGIAPFAMDSHAMVQGWSPMIREVLMTKRMPPGQIDGHIGEFINNMLVDKADQQKLLQWIEAGSPVDGSTDPLAELTWSESKWAFGEPDYIIKLPPQNVPATGVLDYINVVVPIETDKDYWVQGSQYTAGDRTVLHHTLNRVIPPNQEGGRRGGFVGGGDPNSANITAYIPGAEPEWMPENTGGLLKAGSSIALQLHYTTNGKETVDESEIGLWFYPEGEVPEKRMSGACACIFTPNWTNIPAYDPEFVQEASVTLSKDAMLRSFTPHMHFRGKYMRFFAEYPNGEREELINIANYNYNWQLAYTYEEPRLMPAGTKLVAVGAFDNSEQNPYNPDPARSVPWGQQSWDEMFFGAMQWIWADEGGD